MSKQQTQLKKNGAKIFPNPNLIGIDNNNLLASWNNQTSYSYTALEDCVIYGTTGNGTVYLNGKSIIEAGDSQFDIKAGPYTVFLKKGDIISGNSGYSASKGKVYGLKYI